MNGPEHGHSGDGPASHSGQSWSKDWRINAVLSLSFAVILFSLGSMIWNRAASSFQPANSYPCLIALVLFATSGLFMLVFLTVVVTVVVLTTAAVREEQNSRGSQRHDPGAGASSRRVEGPTSDGATDAGASD